MNPLRHIPAVAAALALSGCISTVNVKQIPRNDKAARGLRYSLPATFLLVQPQPDGTAIYSWVYLPDPDKTYVLNKTSILAKFTLDVATSNGLLTSVQAQGDTSAIAAKLADLAQNVYSSKVAANSKASTADAASTGSLKAAVTATQLTLDQATAEKVIVDNDSASTDADKRAAAIKVSNAKLALTAAQNAALSKGVAFDAVGGGGGAPPGPTQQYGAVLFRVIQGDDGLVQLVAMNNQDLYQTNTIQTPAPAAAPAIAFTLADKQKFVVGKNISVKFTSSVSIYDVKAGTSILNKDSLPVTTRISLSLARDKKTITATFVDRLAAGDYSFTPTVILTAGGEPKNLAPVNFTVDAH